VLFPDDKDIYEKILSVKGLEKSKFGSKMSFSSYDEIKPSILDKESLKSKN